MVYRAPVHIPNHNHKFAPKIKNAKQQTESNLRKLQNLRFAEVFVEVPITVGYDSIWLVMASHGTL